MGIENLDGKYYPNPESEGHTLEISGQQLQTAGDEGRIFRGKVENQNMGPMIVKEMNPRILQIYPEARWDDVYKKHKFLRQLGLPVVETIMFDPENNRYLMTDVTQGGSYGFIDRRNKTVFGVVSNPYEVIKNVYDMAKIAFSNGNGVFLNKDAYGLKVVGSLGKTAITDIFLGSYLLKGGSSPINTSVIFTEENAVVQAQYFLSGVEDSLF